MNRKYCLFGILLIVLTFIVMAVALTVQLADVGVLVRGHGAFDYLYEIAGGGIFFSAVVLVLGYFPGLFYYRYGREGRAPSKLVKVAFQLQLVGIVLAIIVVTGLCFSCVLKRCDGFGEAFLAVMVGGAALAIYCLGVLLLITFKVRTSGPALKKPEQIALCTLAVMLIFAGIIFGLAPFMETTGSGTVVHLQQKMPDRTPSPSSLADGYEVITEKAVPWDGGTLRLVHRCQGRVQVGHTFGDERRPISFCLGENQLVAIGAASKIEVLETSSVSSATAAPILLGAEVVAATAKRAALVLIIYSPETCTTTGVCGAGQGVNYATLAFGFDGANHPLHPLTNYPAHGHPTWNPSGTTAIFIPETCGSAGCEVEILTGYDAQTDTAKPVTTRKAAGSDGGPTLDAAGQRLPQWGPIEWQSDTSFVATLYLADGTIQRLIGEW